MVKMKKRSKVYQFLQYEDFRLLLIMVVSDELRRLKKKDDNLSIRKLLRMAGVGKSERQLHRLFHHSSGLSKQLSRVLTLMNIRIDVKITLPD